MTTTLKMADTETARDERRRRTHELLAQIPDAGPAERERLIDEVVIANVAVARSIARRYARRGIPLEDLEQVACLALVRAVRRFDGTRADDFLTYAVPTIRGEVRRWFRDHGWTVRPPRGIQELQARISRVRGEVSDLTMDELAEELETTPTAVTEALQARGCFAPTSLDAPLSATGDGADTIGDLLPGGDGGLADCEARIVLEQALRQLSPRERQVVHLRFVEDRSQAEIGLAVGVSQAQVSRIITRVLDTLRDALGDFAPAA